MDMQCTSSSDGEDEGAAGPLGAIVSGPCWSVPLTPSELADVMSMLSQLRLMVATLAAQGQWHAASAERPASRVKVCVHACLSYTSPSPRD